ncbi:hypothetical protein [Natrialba aegyptia]|nr:hypothetical protein [Natrialba aegyptia]
MKWIHPKNSPDDCFSRSHGRDSSTISESVVGGRYAPPEPVPATNW